MQKFRYRGTSVVVLAAQVSAENADELAKWADAQVVVEKDAITHDETPGLNVLTPDGRKRASVGDHLVQFIDGGFYVDDDYDFNQKYEELMIS
jgi:hypothetical protein